MGVCRPFKVSSSSYGPPSVSKSSYDSPSKPSSSSLPNPNPAKFNIVREEHCGKYTIMEIQYIGCTNYEGHKILMFKSKDVAKLKKQSTIDPHFSDNKDYVSPIARFVPTLQGWAMAKTCANALNTER